VSLLKLSAGDGPPLQGEKEGGFGGKGVLAGGVDGGGDVGQGRWSLGWGSGKIDLNFGLWKGAKTRTKKGTI